MHCCLIGKSAGSSAPEEWFESPADKRVLAEQHRRNISLAIKEKWADPEYRLRASCGIRRGMVQHKRVSSARVSLSTAAIVSLHAFRQRAASLQIIASYALHASSCFVPVKMTAAAKPVLPCSGLPTRSKAYATVSATTKQHMQSLLVFLIHELGYILSAFLGPEGTMCSELFS